MHWKTKARIQNAVSLLPSSLSYELYYWMQRRFGGLRKISHLNRMAAGVATWQHAIDAGYDPKGSVFFEVGTGRVPSVPIALWLLGAEKTITVDLHPYLKSDITLEILQYAASNVKELESIFGDRIDDRRLSELLRLAGDSKFSLDRLLDVCNIQYIAPGDASKTTLADNSVDIHTSYTVYEHIAPEILRAITREGNRITKDDGLFVHRIDYSDHFSHSDSSISKINFLQYSDTEWDKYADNRYMYMNRLRHDDYIEMFESEGQQIVLNRPSVGEELATILDSSDFTIDARFKDKSKETLCTYSSWVVSKQASAQ